MSAVEISLATAREQTLALAIVGTQSSLHTVLSGRTPALMTQTTSLNTGGIALLRLTTQTRTIIVHARSALLDVALCVWSGRLAQS